MIRPTLPEDADPLCEIAAATGVFKPYEIEALGEVLHDYFAFERDDNGHRSATLLVDGRVAGFVYYAPDTITFGTWEMWWIAVDPALQGRGLGRLLVKFCEQDVVEAGGRMLFIDTSSLPEYEATRQFYLALGYDQEAVLRDYFNDGDSKVVFRRRLVPEKM